MQKQKALHRKVIDLAQDYVGRRKTVPSQSRYKGEPDSGVQQFAHNIGIVDISGDIRLIVSAGKIMRQDAGKRTGRRQADKGLGLKVIQAD